MALDKQATDDLAKSQVHAANAQEAWNKSLEAYTSTQLDALDPMRENAREMAKIDAALEENIVNQDEYNKLVEQSTNKLHASQAKQREDANQLSLEFKALQQAIEGFGKQSSMYRQAIEDLLFGSDSKVVRDGRVATIQTLGGSGALKVGADFIQRYFPASSTYVSDYTWDNHVNIFQGAGSVVFRYRYFDRVTMGVDFEGMCADLRELPERSVIVLQPSCHNPTGSDLNSEQ